MKIELKRITHNERMSEETYCFSADVWIDGKKAGEVSNHGHGGCHDFHPRELEDKLDAYGKTLPVIVDKTLVIDGKPIEMEQDGESLVNDILTEWLKLKDFRCAISRRILFTIAGKKGIYQTKAIPAAQLKLNLERPDLAHHLKADKILNIMPEAEARALYESNAK